MTAIEKGVTYALKAVRHGSADHAALHPFTRFPAVQHGERTLFESLAITTYIDEAFDGPALQPTDLDARVRMHTWMGLCGDYVFKDVVRLIPRNRTPTDDELATARGVLERLDALVGTDAFLAGDALTLADLYLAPQISNAAEKAPDVLDGLAAIDRWMAGMRERESFRDTAY
jgi:glutathione S-transferase